MTYVEKLRLVTRLYLVTLVIFGAQQVVSFLSGGVSQEIFEIFADPADYSARMAAAGDSLRIILLLDMFFIIGFFTSIGMTALTHADINRAAAWIAGLGIILVAGLDLFENIHLFLSIDMVDAGQQVPAERILAQAQISAMKWLVAALVLVVFSFTLPSETALERFLIWSTRILMPLGTGLFVTGAFDARLLGGMTILIAMSGGLTLLALTSWLRLQRTGD
ncbi:MAG: hypothetical protein COB40_11705 [Marinosulfonomonas sp.]|nr:MAG: hypothetical protein COB40_11705 [Marinosulfonomonas sp.]